MTGKIAPPAFAVIPREFTVRLGEINRFRRGGVFEEPLDHLVGIDLNILVEYFFILIISARSSSGHIQVGIRLAVAVEIDV